jgi:hypothetical protein
LICWVICQKLVFRYKVNVTLTIKLISVINWPRQMHLCIFRAKRYQVINRNCFYLQGQDDLDIWPLDPKIDRRQSFCQDQSTYKVGEPKANGLSSYGKKTVFTDNVNMTLTFYPLIPKSIGIIYLPRPMHLRSLWANSP